MKKKIQFLMMALLLITAMPVTAQVLWSDDFDSYATGTLSNDPTGQTPGEGGWYNFSVSPVDIISEIGRGNVIAMGKSSVGGGVILSKNIDSLWNNRTAGNDILMFEFDFYTENILSIVPPNTFYTPSLTFLDTTNSNNPFPFGSEDRKSTRLNSSHVRISYAVFCLKKKKKKVQIYNISLIVYVYS